MGLQSSFCGDNHRTLFAGVTADTDQAVASRLQRHPTLVGIGIQTGFIESWAGRLLGSPEKN